MIACNKHNMHNPFLVFTNVGIPTREVGFVQFVALPLLQALCCLFGYVASVSISLKD